MTDPVCRPRDSPDASRPGRADSTGALVIGGDYRGLGLVRSLGRRGIPIWVLTDDHRVAATSRYVRRRVRWGSATDAGRLELLLDLATRRGLEGWTVFPTGDESARLLARHHAELSARYLLTVPAWEDLRWAYDKRLTYCLAARLGVSHPRTFYPADDEEVRSLECAFPVILKPAFKDHRNSFIDAKAWRVEDRAGLRAAYRAARELVPPDIIMVQELVPGGGDAQVSFAALCREGEPLAWLTARRTRQYPLEFGRASTFVETIDLPDLEGPARRLLGAFRFSGLIEIEFKRDARDGRYQLLDLNPRVWGWQSLGHRAGVDFPFLLWEMVHGRPVPRLVGRPGVRWVRLVFDLLALAQQLRRRQGSVGAYLRSLRPPLEFAMLAADDPLPALLDLPLLGYLAIQRRAARPAAPGAGTAISAT